MRILRRAQRGCQDNIAQRLPLYATHHLLDMNTSWLKPSAVLLLAIFAVSCLDSEPSSSAKTAVLAETPPLEKPKRDPIADYMAQFPDDGIESKAVGKVGDGRLEYGKLMPFAGPNFKYFDTSSYLMGRAFLHSKVKRAVLEGYKGCEQKLSERHFRLMECAGEHGGNLFPHRTHQTGMSVDFMVPLQKEGKPFTKLDDYGKAHYFLSFDSHGRWSQDASVEIDFETMAKHLLVLDESAKRQGLRIKKVLLKTELKDELFATPSGKELQRRGIYFARYFEPLINNLHDDHYHVDFE